MKTFSIVFALGLLGTPLLTAAAPNCGSNEVFHTCGTSCVATCSEPNPASCTLACIPGCECEEGYIRNDAYKCVLPTDC
ncbi:chymotrypsin inhibitor-like protein [Aspergillus piperis CBS 112811]|uniref:Chymotrypsin inhibitor-like protein n=1 Tax=Aspergillus piperis CBS 112811 TaxID=1448313 RepID=A0A8G1VNN2_9EURO|nr:chymotrypsin inhibitor-like protein [Aspergillus piperis CBS 112811]RAH58777.1 chymotrypsin inhibitor-like protein [Aspergillus piperis CBS 112811]